MEDVQDVKKYEVEKSVDGIQFSKKADISQIGTEKVYQWTDAEVVKGNQYYRVKKVMADGSFIYSKVVSITMTNVNAEVRIAPNPVKDQRFNLQISTLEKGIYTLAVKNVQGNTVYSELVNHAGGAINKNVIFTTKVSAGLYYLVFSNSETQILKNIVVE